MARDDAYYMRAALRWAQRGVGRTSPNPPVGAVVVRGDRIVAGGYHARAGAPHAEAMALRAAGARARGATLYVTLEPCTHHGRTPPCTDAVRTAGIRRLVIGTPDPNPHVRGDGAGRLRRAGVAVTIGVERAACDELLAPFRKLVTSGLPFVTLKLAASLDGRIATMRGDSKWITGAAARQEGHRLRNTHDAVLVGIDTVLRDDPLLTCRLPRGRDPLRVIVDRRLRIPLRARVLSGAGAAGTVVATCVRTEARLRRLRATGAEVIVVPPGAGGISLRHLLRVLGRRGVMSVLVEGGAAVAASALNARLVDRLVAFYAPKLIGGDGRPMIDALGVRTMATAKPVGPLHFRLVGGDLMVTVALSSAAVSR